jgi:hypothetical protein
VAQLACDAGVGAQFDQPGAGDHVAGDGSVDPQAAAGGKHVAPHRAEQPHLPASGRQVAEHVRFVA